MLHAIIMAGGAGTRFWPASRSKLPKQLLNLAADRTMIQATVDRLRGLIPPERILIVTNEALVDGMRKQLPDLPHDAILGEPCKRDTAPCIGLAAAIPATIFYNFFVTRIRVFVREINSFSEDLVQRIEHDYF